MFDKIFVKSERRPNVKVDKNDENNILVFSTFLGK